MLPAPEQNNVAIKATVREWRDRLWSHQFLRFLVVGAGNTAFGYAAYLLGLLIGLPYTVSAATAAILGALFNFATTGWIVFENDRLYRIFGFLLVYAILILANLEFLVLLVGSGVNKVVAQAALLPCVVILSFVLNKYMVFRKRP
jgi:putative flippase GtrA